jgi:hypothetical protein
VTWPVRAGRLEDAYALTKATRDLTHRRIARDVSVVQLGKRLPEARPADGETDEAGHGGGGLQPLADFRVVLTATEHDAADGFATTSSSGRDNTLTCFALVHSFDFPNVGLNARALK